MRSQSSRKRNGTRITRSAIVLLLMSAASLVVSGIFLFPSASNTRETQWQELNDAAKLDLFAPPPTETPGAEIPRVIYPYSVVPGGVRTPQELREAGIHDRIVGEHYAGFNFRKARVIKVKEARLVYLSYRIGDQIYWTAKRVSLHAGENLITDGNVTARTRCGNQVSALPQKKTSSHEPALAAFDGPIGSSMRVPFPDNFHSALESRPGPGWAAPGLGPAGLVAFGPGGSSPLGGGFLPIGSPVVPGSGGTSSGPGPGPGPGPVTPPVSVPEPGAFALIPVEILGIIFFLTFFSRRIRAVRFHK